MVGAMGTSCRVEAEHSLPIGLLSTRSESAAEAMDSPLLRWKTAVDTAESGRGMTGAVGTSGSIDTVNSRKTGSRTPTASVAAEASERPPRNVDDVRNPGGAGIGSNSSDRALHKTRPMALHSHSSGLW